MTTLAEVERATAAMLMPAEIAPIFPADPQSIRLQARQDPAALGFPVVCIGKRVFIPREGFIRFCRAMHIGKEGDQANA